MEEVKWWKILVKVGNMDTKQEFIKKLKEADRKHKDKVKKGENDFNIFEALGVDYKENYHSAFLAYLLNKEESHYQTIFIEEFLNKLCTEKQIKKFFPNDMSVEFIETECSMKNKRRIDVLIGFVNNFYILIENKIYAKDRDGQIKDYIDGLFKGDLCEKERASKILVIYLTPYQDNPSDKSLGRWRITGNSFQNCKYSNELFYFKMDYQWVKDWIERCLKKIKRTSEQKVGDRTKGENGLNKIILALEQYLEVLDWIIADYEIDEDNPVLKLICNDKYQQDAFEIHNGKKYKDGVYQIIDNVWSDFEEHVVRDFYTLLEKYCDDNKNKGLIDNKEIWYVLQTERRNFSTTKQYRLRFFPKKYNKTSYWVGFNMFYDKPNYGRPSIDLRVHYATDVDLQDIDIGSRYYKIQSKIQRQLESVTLRKKIDFLNLGKGGNLVSWIMTRKKEYSKNSKKNMERKIVEEFLKKMKIFTMDKATVKAYREMVKIVDKEHRGFKQ